LALRILSKLLALQKGCLKKEKVSEVRDIKKRDEEFSSQQCIYIAEVIEKAEECDATKV